MNDKEIDELYNSAVNEWDKQHFLCPKCESEKNLKQTLAAPIWVVGESYKDDINNAWCDCGWSGKVNQLKPKNEASTK